MTNSLLFPWARVWPWGNTAILHKQKHFSHNPIKIWIYMDNLEFVCYLLKVCMYFDYKYRKSGFFVYIKMKKMSIVVLTDSHCTHLKTFAYRRQSCSVHIHRSGLPWLHCLSSLWKVSERRDVVCNKFFSGEVASKNGCLYCADLGQVVVIGSCEMFISQLLVVVAVARRNR